MCYVIIYLNELCGLMKSFKPLSITVIGSHFIYGMNLNNYSRCCNEDRYDICVSGCERQAARPRVITYLLLFVRKRLSQH